MIGRRQKARNKLLLFRDAALENCSNQDWNRAHLAGINFALMTCLLADFIVGGICGSAAYTTLQLHALLLPAGLTIVLELMHMAYCISEREPQQRQQQQQLHQQECPTG